jgi:tetratricopeptide (TPR) repeat protein
MAALRFDVRVIPSTEPAAQQAVAGTVALATGDREAAGRMYRDAVATPVAGRSGWINLAALAVGLGEWQAGHAHATRALQLDRADADAWVNLGAASWNLGLRRDAAQATHRALELSPGLEPAALNYSLMHQAVGQPAAARKVLEAALARNPGSARLQQAMAEVCRLLGDAEAARRHGLRALDALLPALAPAASRDAGPEPEDEAAQARLLATMTDACDRLRAAGIDHHLVGGVVLGIVRQGRPFAGDKDVDIGVAFDADRDAVAAAFADGYRYTPSPGPDGRRWCMGFVHRATGVGVDVFFKQPVDGMLRICLGWPDDLVFDLPAYAVEPVRWQGRDWPMPAPLEDYLVADYGEDWRSPTREVAGHVFDKRWLDSQVSSPSLAAGSVPRAINLGLLRLLAAMRRGRWEKALALCDQIVAREAVPAVAAVRARLLAAGIG